ncbi:MAG TPA: hypothetical protein VM537_26460 [Anaerolineae bacterium]|nr:hypothetical protein [Anaerolineae bacterium]
MSRNQWIILGAFGLAALLIFAGLGSLALTYLTSQPPTPTNTRVMPLTTPTAIGPTATSTAYPTHTPYPTYTPQPVPTAPPVPTSPPAPPPAPTPTPMVDARCVEDENALHLQLLADMATLYEPILSSIEHEIEQATHDRDWEKVRDLQQEAEMYENLKAADIDAETARHQAALAACE